MRALRVIAITGLIVGAMDISSAFILAISRGSTTTRLLQFVASGLIGPQAFEGGASTAALGLGLHFVIAFGLVAIFHRAIRCIVVVIGINDPRIARARVENGDTELHLVPSALVDAASLYHRDLNSVHLDVLVGAARVNALQSVLQSRLHVFRDR